MTFESEDIKDMYYRLPPDEQLKLMKFEANCGESGMALHVLEVDYDPDSPDSPKVILDVVKVIKDIS